MSKTMKPRERRPLSAIAYDIRKDWKNVYFGADPYLAAMATCHTQDKRYLYMYETAEQLVNGFLSNCSTWRGPVAREIKAELKAWIS